MKTHIWWENLWFPVDFPLNQSIDRWFTHTHWSLAPYGCHRPLRPWRRKAEGPQVAAPHAAPHAEEVSELRGATRRWGIHRKLPWHTGKMMILDDMRGTNFVFMAPRWPCLCWNNLSNVINSLCLLFGTGYRYVCCLLRFMYICSWTCGQKCEGRTVEPIIIALLWQMCSWTDSYDYFSS